MSGHPAAWISIGSVSVLSAAALLVAVGLLSRPFGDRGKRLLGARLLGSLLLIASLAASAWGLTGPAGSWRELAAFTLALAGVSLHLLDAPFVLARTRGWEPPSWLVALPLVLPLGLLAYATQHWPATTMPPQARGSTWAGWAGRDAVEDAAGGTGTITLGLAVLAVTIVLILAALRASGRQQARARRMLAQAWLPVAAWLLAIVLVWLGLAVQAPPASPVLHVAQEVLLDGAMAFVLVLAGPLLWGLDELEDRAVSAWPEPAAASESS